MTDLEAGGQDQLILVGTVLVSTKGDGDGGSLSGGPIIRYLTWGKDGKPMQNGQNGGYQWTRRFRHLYAFVIDSLQCPTFGIQNPFEPRTK